MVPSQFFITLQHGVPGGLKTASATAPSASFLTITKSPEKNSIVIQSDAGTGETTIGIESTGPREKDLSQADSEQLVSELQDVPKDDSGATLAKPTELIVELHNILKELPLEDDAGHEIDYGEDTVIFWGSDDLQWKNRGQSEGRTEKNTKEATEEQKKGFNRAVEIIKLLAE